MKRCFIILIAFCISAVMLCTGLVCSAAYVTDGDSYYLLGDANSDGQVNIKDLVRIKKYLADPECMICVPATDINGDEEISGEEMVLMKKYFIFEEEGQFIGTDNWSSNY